MGFGMVIGFIEHLKLVITNIYNAAVNLHTLQFTTACFECSQFAVSSPVVVW
jgi:hypothetical protein